MTLNPANLYLSSDWPDHIRMREHTIMNAIIL